MNTNEREMLEQELLEYVYGCHESPEVIERRIECDAEVRALFDEVRSTSQLFDEAARDPSFELVLPEEHESAEREPARILRTPFFGRGMKIAAALIFALFGLLPCALWGLASWKHDSIKTSSLRLVVASPSGVPDGAPARVHVDTWDLSGADLAAQVDWEAFDVDGRSLANGSQNSRGSFDFDLPANLPGLRRVEIRAQRGELTRSATLEMAPNADAPLVHLTTDKPAYQPGETVRVRSLLLDRISLAPHAGTTHVRIIDAKGTSVWDHWPTLEDGVGFGQWNIPPDARGGEYTLEQRDTRDEFAAETMTFLVRRYQPPRLAKKVDLDRETYGPGESGTAEVSCVRTEGGVPKGASVDGTLIVDGEEVWKETRTLDHGGMALFRFSVPQVVERGEARFVARITDGGVVETQVEPFVVPTGRLDVAFYPEGGDLVVDLENRVYAEVTDVLGRPTSARGVILDSRNSEVARFETQHQGRARFNLEPRLGERYRLEFEEPAAPPVDLPDVLGTGVVLEAKSDVTLAGQPVELTVRAAEPGPFVCGVFCRGVLVGQDTFQGRGEHELAIEVPEKIAGVLRVTVFDKSLTPITERLVARENAEAIEIEVEPASDRLLPGDHQKLSLTARTESGRPIAAVLGLAVTDRAVRDMVGEARIGLADHTWFFSDVEELEEIEAFIARDDESRRNVDLLLGTRGWRRFAWHDSQALVDEHGEQAKRLLVREGRAELPRVIDQAGDSPALLAKARRTRRATENAAGGLAALGGLLLVLTIVWRVTSRLSVFRSKPVLGAFGSLTACVLFVAGGSLLVMTSVDSRFAPNADAGAVEMEAVFDMAPMAEAMPVENAALDFIDRGLAWNDQAGLREEFRKAGEIRYAGPPRHFAFGLAGGAPVPPGAGGGGPGAGPANENELGVPHFWRGWAEEGDEVADLPALQDLAKNLDRANKRAFVRFEPMHQVQRVYAHVNQRVPDGPRSDFTETVYWNPLLKTELDGTARVEFDLSDRVTTWHVMVDAHGDGRVGQELASFEAVPPFRVETRIPFELTEGDRVLIPVALTADNESIRRADVICDVAGPLALDGDAQSAVVLDGGRGRVLIPIDVTGSVTGVGDGARIAVASRAAGFVDSVMRPLRVVPRGFPQRLAKSGVVKDRSEFTVPLPDEVTDGSLVIELSLYPSPLAEIMQGMDGLLQEPGGCFEQASRTNYPNVLALAYMQAAGDDVASVQARAKDMLDRGYDLLTGYECAELGYEWFGGDPGHEALTAFGLLEFHDMAQVHEVDSEMIARTRAWLLDRRDKQGGFLRNSRALDSFGRAPDETTNAYCTYSLLVTGEEPKNVEAEIERAAVRGVESQDPYEVALYASALEAAGRTSEANAARDRLKTMQADDGSLTGETSITRSGGDDLAVETTSFAVLAWLEDDDDEANVHQAVQYLLSKRNGNGTFGTTQATIMALKALTGYARENRRVANSGEAHVFVNDYEVDTVSFEAGQKETIVIHDLAQFLEPGNNRVRLELTGGNEFPWALDVRYTSDEPADAAEAKIDITAELSAETVEEGKTTSLRVVARNLTQAGQPMTMAIIGIPAGLEVPTEVLDDLKKAERFDLWEIQGRELVLYWRDMAPSEKHEVNLDLVARIPGRTTGPASRAYLYYTPDEKRWSAPLTVEVTPAQ